MIGRELLYFVNIRVPFLSAITILESNSLILDIQTKLLKVDFVIAHIITVVLGAHSHYDIQ